MLPVIEKLSPLQKAAVAGGVLGLLLVIFYFFVYQSQVSEVQQLQKEIIRLRTQNRIYQKRKAGMEKDEACLAQLNRCYTKISGMLPERREMNSLMQKIIDEGKKAGLEFKLFQERDEITNDVNDYAVIPVIIHVQGYYSQIKDFFRRILTYPESTGEKPLQPQNFRIITIEKTVLKHGIPSENGILLTAELVAHTYRHLTQQEIKERQARKEAEQNKKGKRKRKKKKKK